MVAFKQPIRSSSSLSCFRPKASIRRPGFHTLQKPRFRGFFDAANVRVSVRLLLKIQAKSVRVQENGVDTRSSKYPCEISHLQKSDAQTGTWTHPSEFRRPGRCAETVSAAALGAGFPSAGGAPGPISAHPAQTSQAGSNAPQRPLAMRPRRPANPRPEIAHKGPFSEGAAHFFPPSPVSSRQFSTIRPVTPVFSRLRCMAGSVALFCHPAPRANQ